MQYNTVVEDAIWIHEICSYTAIHMTIYTVMATSRPQDNLAGLPVESNAFLLEKLETFLLKFHFMSPNCGVWTCAFPVTQWQLSYPGYYTLHLLTTLPLRTCHKWMLWKETFFTYVGCYFYSIIELKLIETFSINVKIR